MRRTFQTALAIATSLFSGLLTAAQPLYLVVVHPENPVDVLSNQEISSFLLRQEINWEHGLAVEPVNLSRNSPVREAFSQEIHNRPARAIENYWRRQIFSGRMLPPPEFETDAEVVEYVRETPGAIGYISADGQPEEVKIVKVLRRPESISSVKRLRVTADAGP